MYTCSCLISRYTCYLGVRLLSRCTPAIQMYACYLGASLCTNHVQEVKARFLPKLDLPDLELPRTPHHPTLNISSHSPLFSLISINMPSRAITSRRETTKEKRADVWAWYKVGKTYNEIRRLTELIKWTVAKIIKKEKKKQGRIDF
jgi:hypothetical protein